MKTQNTKIFIIDNAPHRFNKGAFNNYFKKFFEKQKLNDDGIKTIGVFEEYFAKQLICSKSTVHGWEFGNSGPGDLDTIKNIAEILEISDYMYLMKEVVQKANAEDGETEEMCDNRLTISQTESLKRIFDAVVDYLEDFDKTDGFTGTLWHKYFDAGYSNPEDKIYEYAEKKIEAVLLVIKKEYFYLHDTDAYNEVTEYAYNDLYDIFNGKLGYGYRFEAIHDGNPTATDDYTKALTRLQNIVEKYI